jgi:hypothetical protein
VRSAVKDKAASSRPYLERLAHDDELRETVKHAVKAVRGIVRELKGEKPTAAAGKLATDKKLRKKVGVVIDDMAAAKSRLEPKKSHKLRKLLLLGLVAGGVIALKNKLLGEPPHDKPYDRPYDHSNNSGP